MKINNDNYESYFLRYIEGRLSEEEQREVGTFLVQHPELQEMLDLYDPTYVLEKDAQLVYDDKESLKRRTKTVFMPQWTRYAVAASVALLLGTIGFMWLQNVSIPQQTMLADNTIDIDAIKEVGPCPLHRRTFIKNFI